MKVIVVDDEPKAIELISSYLSLFSNFELVKTFRNGLKALEFLNVNPVDVVFLDINMPHLSGLSLSKMISPKTAIVFTTAYSEHAVESYNINALDYLLKPISLERFSKTITKLNTKFLTPNTSDTVTAAETIFIKSGLETHQIAKNSITYLKKDGNYMHYITLNQKIMARQSIAEALALLDRNFIQVQKSYIVNFKKINSITSDYILIGNKQIPIGLQFKNELLKKVNGSH
ncbi:LytR/AlgR family response regulator transcription factor [Spongiimicrobium salis]|uniref:LytR/AlgR family response regulator transcription factor n=1 Tax=Spongiimicrobium salis TaxID=1667022 RepID=UPI00374C8B54